MNPHHIVEPERKQGRRIVQARWTGWGKVGAFWLKGNQERENVDVTVGRRGRGGVGALGRVGRSNAAITTVLEYKYNSIGT